MIVSQPKLLYVTPKRIITPEFQIVLSQLKNTNQLSRFVIDEAHCIAEWNNSSSLLEENYTETEFLRIEVAEEMTFVGHTKNWIAYWKPIFQW